jgi:predicted ATPase
MINSLRLLNFKCFKDQTIPLKPLTLLTGKNNTGKSTILKVLMLLRHSYLKDGIIYTLILDDPQINLGTWKDILCEQASQDFSNFVGLGKSTPDTFKIEADDPTVFIGFQLGLESGKKGAWCFPCYADDANYMPHRLMSWDIGETEESIYHSSLFTNDFHYIRAERIGIRSEYPMSEYHIQNNNLGIFGEYTAHFLDTYGDIEIPNKELNHPHARSLKLKDQVEAWMGEVSPGIRIRTAATPSTNSVTLEYSCKGSANYSPYNASYGVTHSLPIFVAVLSAAPGSLILIENPESGLHGRTQSAMGNFLAIASSWDWGVQIIAEIHSDHLLNGIRVTTHDWEIDPDDIQINYFQKDRDNQIELITPKIDRDGRINQWPDGFFDQWDQDLMVLLEPAAKTKP